MENQVLEDIKIDEKIEKKIEFPKKYHVIFFNDDVTPMDWVIQVLKTIFRHSEDTAKNLTLIVHQKGSAVVGTYSYEVAEQKAIEANNASREHGFPLTIKLEAE